LEAVYQMKKENELMKDCSWWRKVLFYISPSFFLILFIVVWQLVSSTGKTMLPTPYQTLVRFVKVWGSTIAKQPMIVHVWVSIRRILISLAIAISLGIPFGVLLGWNDTFRAICKPLFEMIRPIPPISLVPLITLWFGTGEGSRIIIIALVNIFGTRESRI